MKNSRSHSHPTDSQQSGSRLIEIRLGRAWLSGNLTFPITPVKGIVLFAHGSGSNRFSPRNQFVASELNQMGLATCLCDLLSLEEEQEDLGNNHYRFDIPMLTQRLVYVTDWLQNHLEQSLPIGYLGSNTGAAAAIMAATERPNWVNAVVTRGGRADMAAHALHKVQAATLILVGELDEVAVRLNTQAFSQLPPSTPKELVTIAGAGHLFEEPGKLAQVTQYTAQWFERYLMAGGEI